MKFLVIYGLLLFLFISCSNDNAPNSQQKEILPNTPESVSKQWQFHLDNNQLEKAAILSTTTTKEWLTENRELFLNDTQIYKTQFVKMNCVTDKDKAICHFIIQEEGELIEDYYLLKKIKGQWLVDIEEETTNPELEEQIFREMKKELKLD